MRFVGLKSIQSRNIHSCIQKQVQVEHLEGSNQGISIIHLERPTVRNAIGAVFLSQLKESIRNIKCTLFINPIVTE